MASCGVLGLPPNFAGFLVAEQAPLLKSDQKVKTAETPIYGKLE